MVNARIPLLIAAVLIGLAGFYLALEELLLRHEGSGYYPAYSTYRSDPQGMSAVYGALGRIPHVTTERNLLPLELYRLPQGATLFVAGAVASPDPVPLLEKLEQFCESGGRLVIANGPCRNAADAYCAWDIKGKDSVKKADDDDDDEEEEEKDKEESLPGYMQLEWLSTRWGLDFEFKGFEEPHRTAVLAGGAEAMAEAGAFPAALPWGSGLYFDSLSPEWRTLYTRNDHAVLIERAMGKGSVVIASDSYFLSNEAMQEHRAPELLAWLAGPSERIIFDETHLGIASSPGIIDLIKRLRLQGFLITAGVAGLLFVWMGLVGQAPRREATARELRPEGQGREAFSGLVSLLQRSVPRTSLLRQCHAEWNSALHLLGPRAKARGPEVDAALAQEAPQTEEALVETYRRISRLIQEKR
jgi:hypothetical protein